MHWASYFESAARSVYLLLISYFPESALEVFNRVMLINWLTGSGKMLG